MKRMFFVLGSEVESDERGTISDRQFFYQVWAKDEEEVSRIIQERHPGRKRDKWYDPPTVDVYFQIAETIGTPD